MKVKKKNNDCLKKIFVRKLGIQKWEYIYRNMNFFTEIRNANTVDEIWLVEHYPIFTIGQTEYINQKKNINCYNNIPVMPSNRGGKITYHGPGQQIVYFLINLKRMNLNIRNFINLIETIVINTLNFFSIQSISSTIHPGIYIKKKKICSFGLRIKKNCTLHGLSLNVKMDLRPFNNIEPCGLKNIKMTQISDFFSDITIQNVQNVLISELSKLIDRKIVLLNHWNYK
ncbi:lipoyl(octanoyl) transferase LipB [Buchnera aphidicola (Thelaxes californica)]|uniref:Octanoyltransferase n=1 Tax=Buchnera aphidicola (Thelaxes californica) TaxID=1315998 RepID=A0A4D6YCC2_9GAMM|nr:lipoyl(octanoyl) transferase LipB [Buchnera aphidicola]QCI26742.1 lipoyl(octanoyl) transferase LipB [Buchnera aphidicola (Thelaxes californica)]